MERRRKIIHNKIKCKYCGEIIESKSRHDFVVCKCWRDSKGKRGVACDGGLDYQRRVGNPEDYEELSETRLYTDEERDEYNENKLRLAEQYPGMMNIDLME